MTEGDRFMNELFRIVSGALRLDIEKVRSYTSFLADKLEKAGDAASAARLRNLLTESDHQLRPTQLSATRPVPVDSESRFPLLERVVARTNAEPPIVLSARQSATVTEFISIAKSYAQLEAQGIETSLGLLMYGPPGCGKSRLARHVAADLGLELYVVRLDGIISSYLGSTSKNIRALFDFASRHPCVLFLDEFDAIAKLRGDTQELGELKRVVNSFIQNLDTLEKHSVVLAATNHDELLDAAIWRRFSYKLQFELPTPDLRIQLFNNFLPPIPWSDKDVEVMADLCDGLTGSDIQEVCLRLHRMRITSKSEPGIAEAFSALQNVSLRGGSDTRFLATLIGKGDSDVANMLRERNDRLYSHAVIAGLLRISKATAHRLVQKGADHA